ncbi:hypothetical protein SSUR61_0011 [Streptococcus suis R61]|uniref:Uncharacterized protein n=1 Tax=Streptococcus suis R61 TaxID=996306 RepID=A0AA87K4M4_STRSU|nr:hypothetical protein SSUR61_0011 [Streptococcus suis R61]
MNTPLISIIVPVYNVENSVTYSKTPNMKWKSISVATA